MACPLPPSFPKGLRVLLLDAEPSLAAVAISLQQLQYAVTPCSTAAEALAHARTAVFDVVLAEAALAARSDAGGRAFVAAFRGAPVALMSADGGVEPVLRAVRLGAVDFLDKPLSALKLRNIWQHAVRRAMAAARPAPLAAALPAQQQQQQQQAAACAGAPGGGLRKVQSADTLVSGGTSLTVVTPAQAAGLPPARRSLDSATPGTPSAGARDHGAEALSAGFAGGAAGGGGAPSSAADSQAAAVAGRASLDDCAAWVPAPRAAAAAAPPPPAAPVVVPPPGGWPRLEPGCTWGTPAGGPTPPPPLPPPPVTLARGACAPVVAPTAARSHALTLPPGFLEPAAAAGAGAGPIGLHLRKSSSLVDLLNATMMEASA